MTIKFVVRTSATQEKPFWAAYELGKGRVRQPEDGRAYLVAALWDRIMQVQYGLGRRELRVASRCFNVSFGQAQSQPYQG